MGGERIRSEWEEIERPFAGGPTAAGAAVPRRQPVDVIAASPVPIVVIDSGTSVRLWNPAAERLFGCSRQEVADGSIPIVPFERRDELRNDRPSGISGIVATFEDPVERHRVEVAAQKMIQTLKTSWDMSPMVASGLHARHLLQTITDACTLLAGAQLGAVTFNIIDEKGAYLLYACSGARSAVREPLVRARKTIGFTPTVASDARDRLGRAPSDRWLGSDNPQHGVSLEHLAVGSYLAVPMIGRSGDVCGGLFLGHPDADVFTRESKRVVLALAAHAAIAIDNARLYEAERRARNVADSANRAKEEFLAVLGHELRNPLATVRNGIATARVDPAQRDRALVLADHGAEQLSRLTDDLRDVAAATQAKIVLRRFVVCLAQIVERAVASAQRLIEARGHAITVSLPGGDLWVEGDSFRLEQVIGNLLSNAAKYTNPGGHITVTVAREDDDAVVRVRDTGMGIAPESLPRVFDFFVQAEQSLDRAQGGLGIGLAVVKHLVELHGGRVEAHSDGCGTGAELVVRLPRVEPVGNAAPQDSLANGDERPRARVLIVEDDAESAELTAILLERLGHRVRTASDGRSALQAALADPPDVMLIDIGLAGIDGYEIAQSARRHVSLRHVSLVALTGYSRDEDRQQALSAGFDYHLVKPVNVDELLGLVARLAVPKLQNEPPL